MELHLSCTNPSNHYRRHNGRDSISNHQLHLCLLNRLFMHRWTKTSKLCVTGLCAGNSPVAGEFPAQMVSNTENVPIWWRHHVMNMFSMMSWQFWKWPKGTLQMLCHFDSFNLDRNEVMTTVPCWNTSHSSTKAAKSSHLYRKIMKIKCPMIDDISHNEGFYHCLQYIIIVCHSYNWRQLSEWQFDRSDSSSTIMFYCAL